MEWLILLIVVVVGLSLILIEIFLLPGVGFAGFLGLGAVGFGIYLGYSYYGVPTGHFILLAIIIVGFFITLYALRSKTWKHFGLNAVIKGSVDGVDESIKVGDTGLTIGRLAPMGKVQVGNSIVEGQSFAGYIDNNQEVEILKVFKDKVIVKLK
ncbi:MAG: hypothetical protein LBM07_05510 [Culturomica sp.]|jgi:membrane-bound ClpP family serine protease|nr:hypothetical protein [Culturomica sp.]